MKIRTLTTLEIVIILALIIPFLPRSGEDYRIYYHPLAQGCTHCSYNPPHASLILKPLSFIPWQVWPAVSLFLLIGATLYLKGDPLKLIIAFPTIGTLWLGQIEAILAAGLALALTTNAFWLQGLGILLMSIKPQVTGPVTLWILWHKPKAAIVPMLFLLVSLILFGPTWPLDWLLSDNRPGRHSWMLASWFPYGLVILLIPAVWRKGPLSILAASALAMPHFSVYSYTLLFLFPVSWWLVPLSWAWVLTLFWFDKYALIWMWVVPLAILLQPYNAREALTAISRRR